MGPEPRGCILYASSWDLDGVGVQEGLSVLFHDIENGTISLRESQLPLPAANYVTYDPGPRVLYVAIGGGDRRVASVSVAPDGSLIPASVQYADTGGLGPAHLCVDSPRRHVFVSNYDGSSFAMLDAAMSPAGRLTLRVVIRHEGSGPDAARQQEAHPHSVLVSSDGNCAFVADLGTDEVVAYTIGSDGQSLTVLATTSLPPRAGPRHMALHGDGTLFVTCELAGAVWVGRDREQSRSFEHLYTLEGIENPSELALSDDGRFLYVASRHAGTIECYALGTGGAEHVGSVSSGGRGPRHFVIRGDYVYVANHHGSTVTVLSRDAATGRLVPTGLVADIPSPACLVALDAPQDHG